MGASSSFVSTNTTCRSQAVTLKDVVHRNQITYNPKVLLKYVPSALALILSHLLVTPPDQAPPL